MLKKCYEKILHCQHEDKKLLALVKRYAPYSAKILDVGCGFGRYLAPLKERGYDVLGIDKNNQIIEQNLTRNLPCMSVDGFAKLSDTYSMIILSHIIEHLMPQELLAFLDHYLEKLKPGGHLIIATPLYTNYFYDDYDHVKPYHPLGLQMIFDAKTQIQYCSRHKMVLQDLWFRKSPFVTTFQRAKYLRSRKTKVLQLTDAFWALLFKLSGTFLGRKDGWIGVYQKVNQ